jgi:peptidoglycan/LPS O-acetylase OafA/YrhL
MGTVRPSPSTAARRLRELDVLRGIAVLLVVGHHCPLPAPEVAAPLRVLGQAWYDCGWTGVELFFVLSGFLVSGLLFTEFQRHGSVRVGRFLVRRGFKICPPFYVMLLATMCYLHATGVALWPLRGYLGDEVVFLQNFLGGLLPHTWTVAIEAQFYLLLAALVALLARLGRAMADPFRPLMYLVPLAGAAALGLRTLAALRHPLGVAASTIPFPLHYRVDTLLWGVLLSYWYHWREHGWLGALRRHLGLAIPGAALLLAPAWVWPVSRSKPLLTVGLTSIALGFALLLALVLPLGGDPRRPSSRWVGALARVGADSYAIYLWHLPVFFWVVAPLDAAGLFAFASPTLAYAVRFATFSTSGVAIGVVMARLVERPSLALRERLFPSRSGGLARPGDGSGETAGS